MEKDKLFSEEICNIESVIRMESRDFEIMCKKKKTPVNFVAQTTGKLLRFSSEVLF